MSNVHGMIRSAYTFDPDVVSNETALDTGEDAEIKMGQNYQTERF